ncbi:ABC-type nitrate/sulfonate/bicarbonate transport system ATPase subunit [Arthrobacter pigmenti]|uniref:ABC-type nitrate/sulfonate/bicarbonate transport system ATPase subunit n=1 Tax=Arthrobacter pigmenti TaxID=271432 RepID=A0A846RRT8_9MICC|nr:ATP-binding cassette domain-containing protein [Arthrobacter pigmenti]NJC21021.1 ABC-type nitrate/sulfonate/bicarbonate transport system ATPase subunit [Arthrobacter pigmenti]
MSSSPVPPHHLHLRRASSPLDVSFVNLHAGRVRDLSLDVKAGEVLAFVGNDDDGAATLLRAAAGLDHPESGSVLLGGEPVRRVDDRCSWTPRDADLQPTHSLQANLALGLRKSSSASEAKAKIAELLDLAGLRRFAKLLPTDVTAEIVRRAALARALAGAPGVMLLDNPFAAVEGAARTVLHSVLQTLHRALPTTVLLATNSMDEALRLADRVVVLGRSTAEDVSTILGIHEVPRQGADKAAVRRR